MDHTREAFEGFNSGVGGEDVAHDIYGCLLDGEVELVHDIEDHVDVVEGLLAIETVAEFKFAVFRGDDSHAIVVEEYAD